MKLTALRRLARLSSWLAALCLPWPGFAFTVELWPDGVVHYRFQTEAGNNALDCSRAQTDLELCQAHKDQVRRMMDIWENALRTTAPNGSTARYVRFVPCDADCPASHVLVRYNRFVDRPESNNMCTYFEGVEKVGRNPIGATELHFKNVESAGDPGKVQPDPIVLHELGHCLGFWHEQNRVDRERWLVQFETPLYCAAEPADCDGNLQRITSWPESLIPRLGNYDYDSIMQYPSYNALGEPRWTDPVGNTFLGNTWDTGFAPERPLVVSARDVSRVLQYQAREHHARTQNRTWGFFQTMSTVPAQANALPQPWLDDAARIAALGSPALAHQSEGNHDVFARGSNGHIYWKAYRRVTTVIGYVNGKPVLGTRNTVSAWQSIGCCFTSDPAAVARGVGRIDVVAINTLGEVQRIKHIDGVWYAPLTLRGGFPVGGNKYLGSGRYVGPGIASRGLDLLDVFVVRADGRLAVTTWRDGNWGAWRTLGDNNYSVSARPAAVALDGALVQLAITEGDVNLYEPTVSLANDVPVFALGIRRGTVAERTPPALTTHTAAPANNRYRVLVTNTQRRVSIRGEVGAWRDIGGIPLEGSGVAAVASGGESFIAVMNGEDATSCHATLCHPNTISSGQVIQPGGMWIRYFD